MYLLFANKDHSLNYIRVLTSDDLNFLKQKSKGKLETLKWKASIH